MNQQDLESSVVQKGSRIVFSVQCIVYKKKDGTDGIQFELRWIRYNGHSIAMMKKLKILLRNIE